MAASPPPTTSRCRGKLPKYPRLISFDFFPRDIPKVQPAPPTKITTNIEVVSFDRKHSRSELLLAMVPSKSPDRRAVQDPPLQAAKPPPALMKSVEMKLSPPLPTAQRAKPLPCLGSNFEFFEGYGYHGRSFEQTLAAVMSKCSNFLRFINKSSVTNPSKWSPRLK